MNIDLKELSQTIAGQFKGLAGRPPGLWPIVPRLACGLAVVIAVVTLGYFGYWSSQFEDQERGAQDELKLKEEYRTKITQAINLEALRDQKKQVDQYVDRLQKQLPSKAEMAALLSDITQASIGRSVTFDQFKPGQVVVKEYYAELPIEVKVTGSYHDIASFAGDMAKMPRIVTLNNMNVAFKDGNLQLDAIVKTFRYLDPEEVNAQRKAQAELDKKNKNKGGKK